MWRVERYQHSAPRTSRTQGPGPIDPGRQLGRGLEWGGPVSPQGRPPQFPARPGAPPRVLAAEGLVLQGKPPREPAPKTPWPAAVEALREARLHGLAAPRPASTTVERRPPDSGVACVCADGPNRGTVSAWPCPGSSSRDASRVFLGTDQPRPSVAMSSLRSGLVSAPAGPLLVPDGQSACRGVASTVRATSTRVVTSSLWKMCRRWVSTVLGLRKRAAAISGLV